MALTGKNYQRFFKSPLCLLLASQNFFSTSVVKHLRFVSKLMAVSIIAKLLTFIFGARSLVPK